MKFLSLLTLLIPCLVFGQFSDVVVYWDAAKTDTQAAIRGTDSLISQAFLVRPDMAMFVNVQVGDTAAALDSSKVRLYAQYSGDGTNYSYTWCGVDSIGLDSTQYDKSSATWTMNEGIDISVTCPAIWARVIGKGLGTNSKAANDSTKWSVHIIRYKTGDQ